MAIDSVLNPDGIAQKLSIPQLQQAIQDGTIPPYIGVPMLQKKVEMEQRMRNASAQPQQGQPSIAEQVMAEAQGVGQLSSNLPQQYAGGGIVAFARGGIPDIEADQFDEDSEDELNDEVNRLMRQMQAMQREAIEASGGAGTPASSGMETPAGVEIFPRSITPTGFTSTEIKKGVSVKEGDQPARTVEERQKSVTKPAGLEELLAQIEQKESGGRRYGKDGQLLTSPKGALGEMQVMPATARDPGFGIRPAEGQNPDELRRVGREYYGKLLEKYGDPKLAAIAYNMGPGATDKWLMTGADPSRLPDETRKYAQGFAEGGITRLQVGGSALVPYSYPSVSSLDPFDWEARKMAEDIAKKRGYGLTPEEFKDLARRRLRMEQARSAFSAAPEFAPGTPAPSAPAAPVEPTPPSAGSRFLGGVAVPGAVLSGGAALAKNQANMLARMTPEAREALTQDIGGDAGIAAAILNAPGRRPETSSTFGQQMGNVGDFLFGAPVRAVKDFFTAPESYAPKAVAPASGAPSRADVSRPPVPVSRTALPISAQDPFGYEDQGIGSLLTEGVSTGLPMTTQDPFGYEEPAEKVAKAAQIAPESEFLKRLQDRISKGYAKLDKQEESDKYLAMLSAGLGIMSGTSPFALSNIGRGGMMGVQSLMQSDASRAAQEAKLMNAELLAERIRTYGETAKEARESRLKTSEMLEEGRRLRAAETAEGKTEGRRIRAGQIAAQMEKSSIDRAEATALAAIKANPVLAMDEAKSTEFIEKAKAAARAKLNLNPLYRKYMKEATEGFDPGEFDVGSDINDLLTKYLKPKK